MTRYKTHRGKEFNMRAFVEKNNDVRAVGNTSMNARGDIINRRTGKVELSANKIAQASAALSDNQSQKVSLKADETIKPVKRDAPATDGVIKSAETKTEETVDEHRLVSSRKINTSEGTATEYEYSDGSIQVVADPLKPTGN